MINLPICCWRMFSASKVYQRQVDRKGLGRTILSQCSTSMHPYHIPPIKIKTIKQTHGYVQTGVHIRILEYEQTRIRSNVSQKTNLIIRMPWSSFLARSLSACWPWNLFNPPWSSTNNRNRSTNQEPQHMKPNEDTTKWLTNEEIPTFFGLHSGG